MPCVCGKEHEPGELFYVTVVDFFSGTDTVKRVGLLVGPVQEHSVALGLVERVQRLVETRDQWAVFYSFGTIGVKDIVYSRKPGMFNKDFPEVRIVEVV